MPDDINDISHTSTYAKAEAAIRKDERSRCSPDIVDALKHYAEQYCEGWCKDSPSYASFEDCGGCRARLALRSPDAAATPRTLTGIMDSIPPERKAKIEARASDLAQQQLPPRKMTVEMSGYRTYLYIAIGLVILFGILKTAEKIL